MVYRWAQQALATSADHPLLPLIWQKFLHLYLRQPGPEFGWVSAFSPVTSIADYTIKSHKVNKMNIFLCFFFHFYRLEAKGCIGKRFFHSAAHIALLKELKQRLSVVCDFHHAASKALKVLSPSGDAHSEGEAAPETPITQFMTSPELHVELVRYAHMLLTLQT